MSYDRCDKCGLSADEHLDMILDLRGIIDGLIHALFKANKKGKFDYIPLAAAIGAVLTGSWSLLQMLDYFFFKRLIP